MKDYIKKVYGDIAKGKKKCCCGSSKNKDVSEKIGYTKKELDAIPSDANMGLGCGNPVALASLKKGETVIDLGSGGGIDVFLASKNVGDTGRVIGIDMTESMVQKAKKNAKAGGFKNVEFKLGEIENIPVNAEIADCIISNCVINLSSDKQKVFNEAFRVLKKSGRLMVSDMVLVGELPGRVKESSEMFSGCIAGALKKEDYIEKIKKAGFSNIKIIKEDAVCLSDYMGSDKVISGIAEAFSSDELDAINNSVVSLKIAAFK